LETEESCFSSYCTAFSVSKYDAFEPLSRPKSDYCDLPKNLKVEWIGTEDDVQKLE
jgi:hypothetical protein